jgi:hypothetical protein
VLGVQPAISAAGAVEADVDGTLDADAGAGADDDPPLDGPTAELELPHPAMPMLVAASAANPRARRFTILP